MSSFTIQDRGAFRLVTSTSNKRFYVYEEKFGLFAKVFIPENRRCIADSFQIALLESIILSSNNNALTRQFWLENRKKLAPNLCFFLQDEIRFIIQEPKRKGYINIAEKEPFEFKPDDYYYSPINTLGFTEPVNYPSNSDDSVWPSSSSSFDFGGGDTGGGGAGGDY
jgi:uncharacterized membrane protein YgcG